jgi:P-type Cu+ transporter
VYGVNFPVSGPLTPLVAAILMPLSSATVVGFVTLATTLTARRLWMKGDRKIGGTEDGKVEMAQAA